jgi:hypothetical protein
MSGDSSQKRTLFEPANSFLRRAKKTALPRIKSITIINTPNFIATNQEGIPMKSIPAYFLFFSLFLSGVTITGGAPKEIGLVLGFADCEPAVFFKLAAPITVKLTNITYAQTGRMIGFKEEIVKAAGDSLAMTIKINEAKWNGLCDSLAYTAEIAGQPQSSPPYDSVKAEKTLGMIAFSPNDPGGVVFGGGDPIEGDATTRLKYDDSGRRLLDTQSFQVRGTSYVITYSDYNYGPVQLGQNKITKLLGYSASLAVKK